MITDSAIECLTQTFKGEQNLNLLEFARARDALANLKNAIGRLESEYVREIYNDLEGEVQSYFVDYVSGAVFIGCGLSLHEYEEKSLTKRYMTISVKYEIVQGEQRNLGEIDDFKNRLFLLIKKYFSFKNDVGSVTLANTVISEGTISPSSVSATVCLDTSDVNRDTLNAQGGG